MNLVWLNAREVVRLFEALGAPKIDARAVGGCVRNAVLGLPVGEIDAATPETPDAVMARLAKAGLRAIPTGLDHGTVTALVDARSFEITSLRRDTACDGRHAAVEFTRDWEEDARRRDFTFNAMSMRGDGTLFDYFGGAADAKAGRVRFVGDPSDRIREDYLRILRLFRFFAWYGRGELDAAALGACRVHKDGLAQLSPERIQAELVKILSAPAPVAALAAMKDCGVLDRVLPEAGDLVRLAALTRIEGAMAAPADWRLRLAALVGDADADALAQRLKFSSADRLRLVRNAGAAPSVDAAMPPALVRAALYRHGAAAIRDRLMLAWARAGGNDARWRAQLELVTAWRPQVLPVSGADVLALGIPQSPRVGELLAAVEDWWIARDFAPSREEALAVLRSAAKR